MAGAIAVSVVTPTPKSTSIATIPPIIKESTQQGVAKLGTGTNPLDQVTILNSSTNAGLALVGPNVQFEYDSAVITAASQEDIKGLSDNIISRNLSGTIYIHGYTDDIGSREHGLVLSAQRAEAVAKLLQGQLHGYPVRLITAGYGEEDPVADNSNTGGAGPQPARDGSLQASGRSLTVAPERYQPRARHSSRCGRSTPSVVSFPWPGYTHVSSS